MFPSARPSDRDSMTNTMHSRSSRFVERQKHLCMTVHRLAWASWPRHQHLCNARSRPYNETRLSPPRWSGRSTTSNDVHNLWSPICNAYVWGTWYSRSWKLNRPYLIFCLYFVNIFLWRVIRTRTVATLKHIMEYFFLKTDANKIVADMRRRHFWCHSSVTMARAGSYRSWAL